MTRNLRHSKHNRLEPRGQSLIELAIVITVLMFMLVGITEYGFLLNNYLNLVDATREATRFGANIDPFYYEEDGTQHEDMNFYVRPDLRCRQTTIRRSRLQPGGPGRLC